MPKSMPGPVLGLLVVLPVLALGCISESRGRDLHHVFEHAGLNQAELRVELYDWVTQSSGILEDVADDIIAATEDRAIQRNAMNLKSNGIGKLQATAFNNDPVVGMVDSWAVFLQLREYMDAGPGQQAFGEFDLVVREAIARILANMETLAGRAAGPESLDIQETLSRWAQENPIESLNFARSSAATELAYRALRERRGTFETINTLGYQVDDLADRLSIYGETIPMQARWQGKIVGQELMLELDQSLVAHSLSLTESLDRLALEVDELPIFVSIERAEMVAALEHEREVILTSLVLERQAVLAAIDRQRLDSHQILTRQIDELVTVGIQQREAATADANAIVDTAFVRIEGLLDDMWTRLALLGAGGILLLAVCASVVIRATQRRAGPGHNPD